MIGFLPELYPNELIYSLISRYHAMSGHIGHRKTTMEVLDDGRLMNIEFLNKFTDSFYKALTKNNSMEDIVMNHTIFPFYAMFLEGEEKRLLYNFLIENKGVINVLGTRKNLYYCPICVKEDRKKYGETYWHRDWQIENIKICPKHKCYLIDTGIEIYGGRRTRIKNKYFLAEEVANKTNTNISKNILEIKISKYVFKLIEHNGISNSVSISEFLKSKLINTKYLTEFGTIKYDLFYSDFIDYCKVNKYQINPMPTKLHIEKIFKGKKYNIVLICLLAIFLNIDFLDIINRKQLDKPISELLDEKIFNMRCDDFSFNDIARTLRISSQSVKKCYLRECKRKNITPSFAIRNWSEIDRKNLPKVKLFTPRYYNGEYHVKQKPQYVTACTIERLLGLPKDQMEHLPSCMDEISKYLETKDEYYAREVVWATKRIKNSHKTLNRTEICKLTNVNKRLFIRAIPHLTKYCDEETANQIKQLIKS